MRLFVAVWPPEPAVAALAALPRPDRREVRWTTPAQWHVTLSFLGQVDGGAVALVENALATAARRAAPGRAVLGPATVRLGSGVLCVPVDGLDALAGDVRAGLSAAGLVPAAAGRPAPFRGHCTLARARGSRSVPPDLVGTAVAASWPVTAVCLVRSTLDPEGARYETLLSATVRS